MRRFKSFTCCLSDSLALRAASMPVFMEAICWSDSAFFASAFFASSSLPASKAWLARASQSCDCCAYFEYSASRRLWLAIASAEAPMVLASSVRMSSTVCFTVASKVASSIWSIPLLACPRATRPPRLKISEKNPMVCSSSSPLSLLRRCRRLQQIPRLHHIGHQVTRQTQDVIVVFGPHVLERAKVVEGDQGLAVVRLIQPECGGGNSILAGEHFSHEVGGDFTGGNGHEVHRQVKDIGFERGLEAHTTVNVPYTEHARGQFGEIVAVVGHEFRYLGDRDCLAGGHICITIRR